MTKTSSSRPRLSPRAEGKYQISVLPKERQGWIVPLDGSYEPDGPHPFIAFATPILSCEIANVEEPEELIDHCGQTLCCDSMWWLVLAPDMGERGSAWVESSEVFWTEKAALAALELRRRREAVAEAKELEEMQPVGIHGRIQ